MGTCLNYSDIVYDVIMDLFCVIFRIFFIINKFYGYSVEFDVLLLLVPAYTQFC